MLGKRVWVGRPTPEITRKSKEVWISKSYLVDNNSNNLIVAIIMVIRFSFFHKSADIEKNGTQICIPGHVLRN